MRLIDADRTCFELERFYNGYTGELRQVASEALSMVCLMPTIEAEPVKHGRWVLKERAHYFKCSLCNEPIPYKFGYSESRRYYNYCPNCGADMRERRDNNAD